MFNATKVRVFGSLIDARDPAAVFGGLPLDRKRAVIDTMMAIAIRPGRHDAAFNPELIDIDWKTTVD